MNLRSCWAAVLAATLMVAACQSVHTQTAPQVSSDPWALDTPTTPPEESAPAPAPVPTATPTPAPRKLSYNSVEGVPGKFLSITFDDGPHATLTPKLLDMLKERGIKATFFLVGKNVAEYPAIVKRMVAEGHEVANHSWSHPSLTKLGADGLRSQIEKTNAAIEAAAGVKPTLIRPPYGATSARLNKLFADDYGMTVAMWSVDPLDWKYRNAARVTEKILAGAAPGAVILVHDIHPSTVAAMPATLDGLKARGYEFVTMSDLIAMENSASRPVPAADPTPAPAAPAPAPSTPEFEVRRYDDPVP